LRGTALLVAALVSLAVPARAADDRVDAALLLDLDLLAEADPARHRDQGPAERLRMLELLRLLEAPAPARPARDPAPGTPVPPRGAR
jgi:hypothetical protein